MNKKEKKKKESLFQVRKETNIWKLEYVQRYRNAGEGREWAGGVKR